MAADTPNGEWLNAIPASTVRVTVGSDLVPLSDVLDDLGGDGGAPALATAAELEAGTVEAARLVSPKLIHDEIARQIAAIPAG